jgi:hypothetical protein
MNRSTSREMKISELASSPFNPDNIVRTFSDFRPCGVKPERFEQVKKIRTYERAPRNQRSSDDIRAILQFD